MDWFFRVGKNMPDGTVGEIIVASIDHKGCPPGNGLFGAADFKRVQDLD